MDWTVASQAPLSMGFFQARILEWVAISYSRGFSWPRDRTHVSFISCNGKWILYHCIIWEVHRSPICKATQTEKKCKILGGKTPFEKWDPSSPPKFYSRVTGPSHRAEELHAEVRCPLREGHAPSSLPHCLPPRIKSSDISFNSESWLEGSTFNQVTNTQNILIQRNWVKLSSVQFSRSVVSNSLRPHGLQHTRPPVHHQLPEFTQTHVHWVGDAI